MNQIVADGWSAAVPLRGIRRRLVLGGLLLVMAHSAAAGLRDMLDAIQSSEFRFARTTSEVPFMPLGWMQNRFYSNSRFEDESGGLPPAEVVQNTFNLGGVLPQYVAERDMLLLGGDLTWDDIAVKSGPYRDQSVLRLTPVAGWLHQFGEEDLVSAFVAPIFSKELRNDGPWGYGGYAGVIGMHWFSERFQLLYGGVYQNNFGQQSGYPYLGVMWYPTPRCALALVFPWPTFSYTPADRWLLQLTLGPGGSSWIQHGADYEATESLTSWNLTAGVGYRFHERLWLFAGAGVAGLRGVEIESNGHNAQLDANPSPVFSLSVQFRP